MQEKCEESKIPSGAMCKFYQPDRLGSDGGQKGGDGVGAVTTHTQSDEKNPALIPAVAVDNERYNLNDQLGLVVTRKSSARALRAGISPWS